MSHSDIVGGSTASRVMACPGSVKLSRAVPPRPSTSYAREGTLLHHVVSEVLSKGLPPESFLGVEIDGAVLTQELLDEKLLPALEVFNEINPDDFVVETRVSFGDFLPGVFGSADVIGRIGKRAIMLDWKFGSGVVVEAEESPQLLFYTAAAMRTEEARWAFEGVDEIECIIVQPPHVRRWVTTPGRVLAFERDLAIAVREALGDTPRFAMGKHCRWCAGKPLCPVLTGAADRAVQTKLALLSGEDIAEALRLADTLEDWIADLRELAQQMLENEKRLPGWKLVPKRGTRKWINEERALSELEALGLDGLTETTLLSPAKVDALLKKRKLTMPEDLVVSVSTGNTIAPADDPRPEAVLIGKQLVAALGKVGVK